MKERDTVMVEGCECILFPIPAVTQDDPLDDADWFGKCFFARLNALNQSGSPERSREMSLAITNLQQALMWLESHTDRRRKGIPDDDAPPPHLVKIDGEGPSIPTTTYPERV